MTDGFLKGIFYVILIADVVVIFFLTHRLAPFLATFLPELAAAGPNSLLLFSSAFFCAVLVSAMLFLFPYLTAAQDRKINVHDVMNADGHIEGSSQYIYLMSLAGFLIGGGLELFVFYTNTMERISNPYNTDPLTWGDVASAFLVALFFTVVHILAAGLTGFSYAHRQQMKLAMPAE